MIRNLKALGLALVAVFAMSAFAVSAASAQQGSLTAYDTVAEEDVTEFTLTGENKPEGGVNALTAFGNTVKCPNAVYTGHKVETTEPHELLHEGATEVTITPHYGTCSTAGAFPTTVFMNSCDFTFDLGETTPEEENIYEVIPTVHCNTPGDSIDVIQYTDVEHLTPFCKSTITPETEYNSIDVEDETNGHLRVFGTVNGIAAHKIPYPSHPSIFCPSEQTTEEGVLHLDVTIDADDGEGNTLDVKIVE